MPRPPKEYRTFTSLVDKLLAVSKTDLDILVSEAKEKAALNPRKRGPKPKTKAG